MAGCTSPWSLRLGFRPADLDAAAAIEGGVEVLAPTDEMEAEGMGGGGVAAASAAGAGAGALGVSVSLGLGADSGAGEGAELGISLMCGKGRRV